MKTKKQVKFIYEGLGFPIELHNVNFVMVGEEWSPVIDVRKVSSDAIKGLSLQKNRLTGNQIRFVRDYLGMSLRDFADKVVHQSHMAVSKWEKFDNEPTNMDSATELVLRLYICHDLFQKKPKSEKTFMKAYEKISSMQFKKERHATLSL